MTTFLNLGTPKSYTSFSDITHVGAGTRESFLCLTVTAPKAQLITAELNATIDTGGSWTDSTISIGDFKIGYTNSFQSFFVVRKRDTFTSNTIETYLSQGPYTTATPRNVIIVNAPFAIIWYCRELMKSGLFVKDMNKSYASIVYGGVIEKPTSSATAKNIRIYNL